MENFLDTDLYKITMGQAICQNYPKEIVQYEFFNRDDRDFPDDFDVILKKKINQFRSLTLTSEEKSFLYEKCYYLTPMYIDFLSGYRFDPNEVLITQKGSKLFIKIQGYWFRTVFWEVPLMATISQLYFEMTKKFCISREKRLQNNKTKAEFLNSIGAKISDFGTRRRYNLEIQDEMINDFLKYGHGVLIGTSNVMLAKKYNLSPIGTQAHEWISGISGLVGVSHANKFAMEKWVETYRGELGVALPDTFGTTIFLNDFSTKYAKLFDGVRQDSGNPIFFAKRMIKFYESLKISPTSKTIVFSDNLNIEKIKNIHDFCKDKIIDRYGVGTNLSNDVGVEPLNIVIKLIKINNIDVVKLSDNSISKATGNKKEIEFVKKSIKSVTFYTYILCDSRKPGKYKYGEFEFDYEPFYIGKGRGKRAENHINRREKYRSFLSNKINSIINAGLKIKIKYFENLSELEAFQLEKDFIKTIGRKDKNTGPLINFTDGGEVLFLTSSDLAFPNQYLALFILIFSLACSVCSYPVLQKEKFLCHKNKKYVCL